MTHFYLLHAPQKKHTHVNAVIFVNCNVYLVVPFVGFESDRIDFESQRLRFNADHCKCALVRSDQEAGPLSLTFYNHFPLIDAPP